MSVRAPLVPERPTYAVIGSDGGVGNAPCTYTVLEDLGLNPTAGHPTYAVINSGVGVEVPRTPMTVLEDLGLPGRRLRIAGLERPPMAARLGKLR